MGNCICSNGDIKWKKLKGKGSQSSPFQPHCKTCIQKSQTYDCELNRKTRQKIESNLSSNANSSLASSFSDDQIIQEDIRNTYEIDIAIGHGSFSTVRKAHLKSNINKHFAIKTIKRERIEKELPSLKREITVLQNIDHPNIIKVFETYEDEKYYHIVMELCEGGELFERIIQMGTFGEKKAAIIMHKVLSAINHLHENEICHRDIKPENFLFQDKSENSEIKLIDFGFSRKYGQAKMETMIGTPFYLAPEILQGKYGPECDI